MSEMIHKAGIVKSSLKLMTGQGKRKTKKEEKKRVYAVVKISLGLLMGISLFASTLSSFRKIRPNVFLVFEIKGTTTWSKSKLVR